MMQQYMELKKQYSDCILLFRLGDFYEMFLDDAKLGAKILGIVLTGRSRGKDGRIPMAGVPYHAIDSYLSKLILAGHKVALCEQVTEPTGKGLVERKVVRVITPGTVLDERTLKEKEHTYLLALQPAPKALGVALVDLSTGQSYVTEFPVQNPAALSGYLQFLATQFPPAECVLSPATARKSTLIEHIQQTLKCAVFSFKDWPSANTAKKTEFGPAGTEAWEGLLQYLEFTQKTTLPHLQDPEQLPHHGFLQMSHSTMLNLELFQTLRGDQNEHSFLQTIDRTLTNMGGRLLNDWLHRPLTDLEKIENRLTAVEWLLKEEDLRTDLRRLFGQMIDLERLISRLSVGLGTPRDLIGLKECVRIISAVKKELAMKRKLPPLLTELNENISQELEKIVELIDSQIVDQPAIDPKHGGVIRSEHSPELQALHEQLQTYRQKIAELELDERQKTRISSLKIKFNQVFGYFIEVSKANLDAVPEHFWRKQTLVNAERFTTQLLTEYEQVVLKLETETHQLEYQVFTEVQAQLLQYLPTLHNAIQAIAQLDCVTGFAELAATQRYTRPTLTSSTALQITGGRHPVLEQILPSGQLVSNDIELDSEKRQILLITGPNMAGKSVLMRQTALITLLAHLGSFVPAISATIPLTDQIFVRSGAADMITAGLSTFMVEMVETAAILRQLTPQSLVIMDEIGRGTSTYDGISLAWAIVEHLANVKPHGPKTLFATHYHELQELSDLYPEQIHNMHMAITNQGSQPVFLYTLKAGPSSHSFGVAVAEKAGLPTSVTHRAKKLLQELEQRTQSGPPSASAPEETPPTSWLTEELTSLPLENLTPLAALNLLAEWQERLHQDTT